MIKATLRRDRLVRRIWDACAEPRAANRKIRERDVNAPDTWTAKDMDEAVEDGGDRGGSGERGCDPRIGAERHGDVTRSRTEEQVRREAKPQVADEQIRPRRLTRLAA